MKNTEIHSKNSSHQTSDHQYRTMLPYAEADLIESISTDTAHSEMVVLLLKKEFE